MSSMTMRASTVTPVKASEAPLLKAERMLPLPPEMKFTTDLNEMFLSCSMMWKRVSWNFSVSPRI